MSYKHIFIEYDQIKEKFQQVSEENGAKARVRVEKAGRNYKE